MKLIKAISLGLVALCLGACAHKQPAPSTATSTPVHVPAK